jgi:hypothetical protein
MVAAIGVAVSSPTPIPLSTACVANVPVMLLAKAWKIRLHNQFMH